MTLRTRVVAAMLAFALGTAGAIYLRSEERFERDREMQERITQLNLGHDHDPPVRRSSHVFNPERAARTRNMMLARNMAVLLLLTFFVFVILGGPLRRLKRLTEEVRDAARKNFETGVTIDGRDEITDVARAFNDATARVREQVTHLQQRDASLTEYVLATTHDLAIPLTVLQGRLSEAESRILKGESVDREIVEAALGETHYLSQLVANMGIAARFDTGAPHLELSDVDLGALVERVVARHQSVARSKRIQLDVAVPEAQVTVRADEILLERAIGNLVHNAIRHPQRVGRDADAVGHVAVTLDHREGDSAFSLCVIDDGDHVDGALLVKLARTEPMSDVQRSRGRGLGLRIARDIAKAHGFSIDFEMHDGGGLRIRLAGRAL